MNFGDCKFANMFANLIAVGFSQRIKASKLGFSLNMRLSNSIRVVNIGNFVASYLIRYRISGFNVRFILCNS